MNREEFLEKVKELHLPMDSYIVIGSGLLTVLGLRSAQDVDLVIAPHLRDQFEEDNIWKKEEKWGKTFYTFDVYDVATGLAWKEYPTTFKEALGTALYIEEVPFLNVEETIRFKRALGREKDEKDIELLEKYGSM